VRHTQPCRTARYRSEATDYRLGRRPDQWYNWKVTSTQIKILAVLGALVGILAIFTAIVFALDPDDGEPKTAVSLPTATSAPATVPPTAVTAVRGTPSPSAASPAPAQTPATSPTPARAGVVVRAPVAANIRRGPGTEFPIIVTLAIGDELPATGRVQDGSWLFVTLTDGTGWVALDVIEVVNGAAASLPVVAAPTPPPAPPPTPVPPAPAATAAPANPASRPPATSAPAATANPGVGPIRTAPPPPAGPATRIPTVPPPGQ
jgi:hypothetical protein